MGWDVLGDCARCCEQEGATVPPLERLRIARELSPARTAYCGRGVRAFEMRWSWVATWVRQPVHEYMYGCDSRCGAGCASPAPAGMRRPSVRLACSPTKWHRHNNPTATNYSRNY